jgi:hypothetical protein
MIYDNKLKLYYTYENGHLCYGETIEKCQDRYNESKKIMEYINKCIKKK